MIYLTQEKLTSRKHLNVITKAYGERHETECIFIKKKMENIK